MATQHNSPSGTNSPEHHKKFYIFGHNISHSLSPTLHNAGFRALGLPHHYAIHETPAVDASVAALVASPRFGGASVTFPHKLQVGHLLSALSPSARAIGAVNTIVVRETGDGARALVGDNTDWLGIKACIERTQAWKDGGPAAGPALVLGAGGAARAACFALLELGVREVVVVNRTKSKAVDMARNFEGEGKAAFRVFDSFAALESGGVEGVRIIVACVPADDLTDDKVPRRLFEGAGKGGVLVEMAYRPPETGMMKVARSVHGWEVFRGTDVLEEQAYAQFELWTGKRAPVEVMREAMQAEIKSRM